MAVGISHITVLRDAQFWKHQSSIIVTEDGIYIKVRDVQSLKQPIAILVTEGGIIIDLREVQPEKQ